MRGNQANLVTVRARHRVLLFHHEALARLFRLVKRYPRQIRRNAFERAHLALKPLEVVWLELLHWRDGGALTVVVPVPGRSADDVGERRRRRRAPGGNGAEKGDAARRQLDVAEQRVRGLAGEDEGALDDPAAEAVGDEEERAAGGAVAAAQRDEVLGQVQRAAVEQVQDNVAVAGVGVRGVAVGHDARVGHVGAEERLEPGPGRAGPGIARRPGAETLIPKTMDGDDALVQRRRVSASAGSKTDVSSSAQMGGRLVVVVQRLGWIELTQSRPSGDPERH